MSDIGEWPRAARCGCGQLAAAQQWPPIFIYAVVWQCKLVSMEWYQCYCWFSELWLEKDLLIRQLHALAWRRFEIWVIVANREGEVGLILAAHLPTYYPPDPLGQKMGVRTPRRPRTSGCACLNCHIFYLWSTTEVSETSSSQHSG